MTANRTYEYRLYPTKAQAAGMDDVLRRLSVLYNAALQERRDAWRKQKVSVTKKMQDDQLKSIREDPEYRSLHFHLLQDAISRCDLAFRAFFRRAKNGQAGYPRFKKRGQYSSFLFKDAVNQNGVAVCAGGSRLRVHGVGKVKIKLHRAYGGKLKQVRIIRRGDGHWYAQFICSEALARRLPATGRSIGIDLGISKFIATSDGDFVANPRFDESSSRLPRAQAIASRRRPGSNRRRKQQCRVRKLHTHVSRQRRDFHHKVAAKLVSENDMIAVESLNIAGLGRGLFSRQIHDAGWGYFIKTLAYKAESAGREVVMVNPSFTSQICSDCGAFEKKELSARVHKCMQCGLVLDRDANAARNILRLGQSLRKSQRAPL